MILFLRSAQGAGSVENTSRSLAIPAAAAFMSQLRGRPDWLRVDRLLGGHGGGRIHFHAQMEERRGEGEAVGEWAAFRRGWRLGAEDFAQRLSERLGRRGHQHELARARSETDEHLAERLVQEWLAATGWSEADLPGRTKRDAQKVELARLLRRHTPMLRLWIADRLHMGSAA